MDLSTFGSDETAEAGAILHLRHPATDAELRTEGGEPIWLRLASTDSERVRRVNRRALNRRYQQMRSNRVSVTAEGVEGEALEALVAAVIEWGNIDIGEGVMSLCDENVRRFYRKLPWAREQVDTFIADRGNYSKASQAA